MEDPFIFRIVERLPIGDLPIKQRAGGQTALERLKRAEYVEILQNLSGLLEGAIELWKNYEI